MTHKPLIKICGMTSIDNLSRILFLEPDYVGFIFYPKSPRYVVGKIKPDLLSIVPPNVTKVGVFVNATEAEILHHAVAFDLGAVQLHGAETPELCRKLKQRGYSVIKTFSIAEAHDFDRIEEYADCVDFYLFDTKSAAFGGAGTHFDWQLVLRHPIRRSWFLAGGIGPDNIAEASQTGAAGLDLNSRFEIEPGIKDYSKLATALSSIRA